MENPEEKWEKAHHSEDEYPHQEEHVPHMEEEGEPWLVSYADLMTLLFGFFAMMFSYASFDEEGMVKVRKEIAMFFGGTVVDSQNQVPQRDKKDETKRNEKDQAGAGPGAGEGAGEKKKEEVKQEGFLTGNYQQIDQEQMKSYISNKASQIKDAGLRMTPDGIEISFITSLMFSVGDAKLSESANKTLEMLVKVVKIGAPGSHLRVEGHTDDNPINTSVFPSNWELSAARAGAIVRFFEKEGFPSDKLEAIGYGSSRPAFPNRDAQGNRIESNQSRNRRVVIKVFLPEPEDAPKKDVSATDHGEKKSMDLSEVQ